MGDFSFPERQKKFYVAHGPVRRAGGISMEKVRQEIALKTTGSSTKKNRDIVRVLE